MTAMLCAVLGGLVFTAVDPPAQAPAAAAEQRPAAALDAPRALRLQIDELSWEILSLDTQWPPSSVVTALLGASFGPSFTLIGGGMLALGLSVIPGAIVPGAAILGVGLVGIVLTVYGAVTGTQAVALARARRQQLLGERAALQARLRE